MELGRISDARAGAIEWHIRLQYGDAAEWEMFARWLDADASHAAAYDAIERADDALGELLPGLRAPVVAPAWTPDAPGRRAWRWPVWAGALAASIAVGLVVAAQLTESHYEVQTAPGEQRSLTVDGTSITLNGSTRLVLDRRHPRRIALAQGEALFDVRHDPGSPFRLEIGDDEVQDVGTVFNAVRGDGEVRVAVSKGAVTYNRAREAVALRSGDSLTMRGPAATLTVTRTDVVDIGSWRSGRLAFDHEPLSRVAADLGRSLGTRITVTPEIAARPFSGTIRLDRSGATQLTRLGRVLQVGVRASGDGWILEPARVAAR